MSTLSIVMPIYNGKIEFIEQAFNSVMQQTFNELFELLLIDDGSSDTEVRQCIDRLANSSSTDNSERKNIVVRLIRFAENRGIVAALNEGIRQSTGSVRSFFFFFFSLIFSNDFESRSCSLLLAWMPMIFVNRIVLKLKSPS